MLKYTRSLIKYYFYLSSHNGKTNNPTNCIFLQTNFQNCKPQSRLSNKGGLLRTWGNMRSVEDRLMADLVKEAQYKEQTHLPRRSQSPQTADIIYQGGFNFPLQQLLLQPCEDRWLVCPLSALDQALYLCLNISYREQTQTDKWELQRQTLMQTILLKPYRYEDYKNIGDV